MFMILLTDCEADEAVIESPVTQSVQLLRITFCKWSDHPYCADPIQLLFGGDRKNIIFEYSNLQINIYVDTIKQKC